MSSGREARTRVDGVLDDVVCDGHARWTRSWNAMISFAERTGVNGRRHAELWCA